MKRRPKKGKAIISPAAQVVKSHPTLTELTEAASDRDSRATESPNNSTMNLSNSTSANLEGVSLPLNPVVPADVQSEISGDSVASNNSASYSVRGADASGDSTSGSKHSGHDDREITATVELLKGGCVPGDLVPVKIRVEHNRYMKSLNGIIVTLYRQGRVDCAPPISSFTGLSKEDAKRLERDEYYPRSKTGLSGLSLSSAGSCSVFRKDLSQAVAPLIIDPATFTANITTAVRVPEDAFPSIRNVPGGLITFKYHIEVIVDLGGKLAGPSSGSSQSQHPARMVSSPSVRGTYGIDMNLAASWNSTIIDTDHIRREKGVISVSFEVVVGTTDSSKSRGKAVARPHPPMRASTHDEPPVEEDPYDYGWQNTYNGDNDYQEEYTPSGPHEPQPRYYPVASPQTARYDFQTHETQAPVYVPPPEIPDENTLTDKERARRAEQRLLPSQPPLQPPETAAGPSQQPSAPPNQTVYPEAHNNSFNMGAVGPGLDPLITEIAEEPSAPTLGDIGAGPFSASASTPRNGGGPTDDKQELERQRLLAEASAPPEIPEDYDGGGGGGTPGPSSSSPPSASAPPAVHDHHNHITSSRAALPPSWSSHEPSAPTLDEDDSGGGGSGSNGDYRTIVETSNGTEHLPRYER
ncbi:hypothetical protein NPX13_g8306 [Xylaria arbuscula]|uniref:Arrestin C-terminal-like domain-containing protein n=1 Tax=Xylaria arbuscula TaxID=114810 RepID=A0A9W8N902_9PEZI|nr:hypothetical protein NPX13_g8306 [Xylaria arbuscula]